MKYSMIMIFLLISLFSSQPATFAAGSSSSGEGYVSDSYQSGKENNPVQTEKVADSPSPSLFPLFMKFIGSFVLVIVLLFLLLRYLSKRSQGMQASGPILPLGGQMLGNNRSLQVLLIGQTIYIVGVGENVTLIRTVSQGEEFQQLLKSYETQNETLTPREMIYDTKKLWNSVFRNHMQKMQRENREE